MKGILVHIARIYWRRRNCVSGEMCYEKCLQSTDRWNFLITTIIRSRPYDQDYDVDFEFIVLTPIFIKAVLFG